MPSPSTSKDHYLDDPLADAARGEMALLSGARQVREAAMNNWRSVQKQIGRQMKEARAGSKLSLREVARRLDCSAPFVSDLEGGRRDWSEKWVLAYHEAISKYRQS